MATHIVAAVEQAVAMAARAQNRSARALARTREVLAWCAEHLDGAGVARVRLGALLGGECVLRVYRADWQTARDASAWDLVIYKAGSAMRREDRIAELVVVSAAETTANRHWYSDGIDYVHAASWGDVLALARALPTILAAVVDALSARAAEAEEASTTAETVTLPA